MGSSGPGQTLPGRHDGGARLWRRRLLGRKTLRPRAGATKHLSLGRHPPYLIRPKLLDPFPIEAAYSVVGPNYPPYTLRDQAPKEIAGERVADDQDSRTRLVERHSVSWVSWESFGLGERLSPSLA